MKNSIPTPIVIAAIVIVVALGAFIIYKGMSGPPEFAAPNVSKTIPRYVFDRMSPEQQAKMKADGYAVTDSEAKGNQPSGAPSSP